MPIYILDANGFRFKNGFRVSWTWNRRAGEREGRGTRKNRVPRFVSPEIGPRATRTNIPQSARAARCARSGVARRALASVDRRGAAGRGVPGRSPPGRVRRAGWSSASPPPRPAGLHCTVCTLAPWNAMPSSEARGGAGMAARVLGSDLTRPTGPWVAYARREREVPAGRPRCCDRVQLTSQQGHGTTTTSPINPDRNSHTHPCFLPFLKRPTRTRGNRAKNKE